MFLLQKSSCLLLFLPPLLLLFPTFVQSELVVNGTTLQNGDFPYTESLPLYNYSCTGLLWPVSFLPGCTLNLTNVVIESTSILLLAPWKSAEAAGCVIYPDVIPQINSLPILPCAVVFVSTVSTVGLFDFEPFGIYASSFLNSFVPLTLLPSNVGTTLVNSLIASATPQLATLTAEPSPYTVLFSSQAFQGYRWFFFTVYLIGLILSAAYALFSLPLQKIQIYPYSLTRISALCFLAVFCLARVLELGVDPDGSTGALNALGRIVMAWCGTYAAYLAYSLVLFQWVVLVQRLKGLFAKTINTGKFAKWGVKVTVAFFPVIILFIGLQPVYPQLQYATIAFEVILALMVIFGIVCFFVFGTNLLEFLNESKAAFKNPASALVYRKVAILTILNDIALLLVLIALIFTLVNQFVPTIAMFLANHAFQDIAYTLFLISLLTTLSVRIEREKTSTIPKDSTSGDFERSQSSSFRAAKKPNKDSIAILYEAPSMLYSTSSIASTDI